MFLCVVPGVVPRSEAGLPAQGFVFCSFNSLYKITPTLFLAWIKILNAVPRSVLWLLREPSDAEHNLLQFAKDRGLDPSRVRFTHKVLGPGRFPHSRFLVHSHTRTSLSMLVSQTRLTQNGGDS
eukprot:3654317-Rhodomonas_salina.2